MLRKNLEVFVLLNIKKPTNRRKQILKSMIVKISQFLSQWRSSKDQAGNIAGTPVQLTIPFVSRNCCTHFLLTSPSCIVWINSRLEIVTLRCRRQVQYVSLQGKKKKKSY